MRRIDRLAVSIGTRITEAIVHSNTERISDREIENFSVAFDSQIATILESRASRRRILRVGKVEGD